MYEISTQDKYYMSNAGADRPTLAMFILFYYVWETNSTSQKIIQ